MANVQHSTLTGTSLHESKGVAAAAANKVFVTDGATSGSWTTVPAAALSAGANPFGAQRFHVRDQKGNANPGGTFTSGAWQTRTLQTTMTNQIAGASLSANQITLPAGTYDVDACAIAYLVNNHIIKLRNISDSSDTLIGMSGRSQVGSGVNASSRMIGRFTIAATKVFELQNQCDTTGTTNGFGNFNNFGVVEVYAEVVIWKVA